MESFEDAELIVIDELGFMELKSKKFQEVMDKILKSGKFLLITLHRNLVEKYKDKGGKIFWLERENFDEVREEVIGRLNKVVVPNSLYDCFE
jgi:nucleoside-triphosphatase